jgi:hypothetical protein
MPNLFVLLVMRMRTITTKTVSSIIKPKTTMTLNSGITPSGEANGEAVDEGDVVGDVDGELLGVGEGDDDVDEVGVGVAACVEAE